MGDWQQRVKWARIPREGGGYFFDQGGGNSGCLGRSGRVFCQARVLWKVKKWTVWPSGMTVTTMSGSGTVARTAMDDHRIPYR